MDLSGQVKDGDLVVTTWEATEVPLRGDHNAAGKITAYEAVVETSTDGVPQRHTFIITTSLNDPLTVASKVLRKAADYR